MRSRMENAFSKSTVPFVFYPEFPLGFILGWWLFPVGAIVRSTLAICRAFLACFSYLWRPESDSPRRTVRNGPVEAWFFRILEISPAKNKPCLGARAGTCARRRLAPWSYFPPGTSKVRKSSQCEFLPIVWFSKIIHLFSPKLIDFNCSAIFQDFLVVF